MNTQNMEKSYQDSAVLINELIPEEWDNVILYARVTEGGGEVFFYYLPKNKDTYVYSNDITDIFNLDENEFDALLFKLYRSFRSLWTEFINNKQELWSSLTFFLKGDGEFKIDYDYRSLSDIGPLEHQIYWEFKMLGKSPKDDFEREMLNSCMAKLGESK